MQQAPQLDAQDDYTYDYESYSDDAAVPPGPPERKPAVLLRAQKDKTFATVAAPAVAAQATLSNVPATATRKKAITPGAKLDKRKGKVTQDKKEVAVSSNDPQPATSSNAPTPATSSNAPRPATSPKASAPEVSHVQTPTTAVAEEDLDMIELGEAFNSQDSVGCIPVANYTELHSANMEDVFEDLQNGPASFITLQNVTDEQYDEFIEINNDNDKVFLTARSRGCQNLFLSKASRCRSIEKCWSDSISIDRKAVLHFSVVRVLLHVPLRNMSNVSIANAEVTDHTQEDDIEHVADYIANMVLKYDVRIMGGKFGEYLVPLITTLRGSGILVNVAAWLPFRTFEKGEEEMWLRDSNILIFGQFQD